ncbi:MAG: TetR/AcrR family transcriptional regulator [Myxococcales bacterium]|nr:TetR/AcrR family transcriptional regulator [Myxococcales bacterium]MBL9112225.1 TetR/AcrR family transcriptional regulator [Myxococcales bacterium]
MPPPKKKLRRDSGRPRGEPIEAAVLACTLEEIAEHGVDGVSVERIARAAEVNKTSVYRRFGSRDALIAAALERVANDVGQKLSDRGSLRKDLELVAEEVARLLRTPHGEGLARAAFADPGTSELSAFAAREMGKPRAAALAMVERARARGEWCPTVSPEVALAALVGALLHRALLERAPLTPAYVRQVVDLVAAGVTPRAAPR